MSQQTITNEQWAAAETNPYRTPEEDLKLWEKYQPKKYAEAKKLCEINRETGGFDFPMNADTSNWEYPNNLTKDLSRTGVCPQRPFDPDHLYNIIKRAEGRFSHSQSGGLHRAYRPDGTSNTWDDYHTSMFATLAGIKVHIIAYEHDEDATIEECREKESEMFNTKNGKSKPVGNDQTFEKTVTELKTKKNVTDKNVKLVLSKLLNEIKLCPTGKTKGYTKFNGIQQFEIAYKELQKHYEFDDVILHTKKILSVQMKSFPNADVSSYFHEAISFILPKVRDLNLNLKDGDDKSITFLDSLQEFFITQRQSNGTKVGFYINTTENIKNKSKQSIALRIISLWNDWYFNTGRGKKRPITKKRGYSLFSEVLPVWIIDAHFKLSDETKEVTCPECSNVFDA